MSFADVKTLQSRLSRPRGRRYATVELGHEDFANGLIVKVEHIETTGELRAIIEQAYELAATYPQNVRRLADPGWWAGIIAEAANRAGYPAAFIRGKGMRSRNHACLIVAHGTLLDSFPAFPRTRMGTSPYTLDLRGELCVALGPSNADFDAYRAADPTIDASNDLMRRMFEQGVLEWASNKDGDPIVVAAGRTTV